MNQDTGTALQGTTSHDAASHDTASHGTASHGTTWLDEGAPDINCASAALLIACARAAESEDPGEQDEIVSLLAGSRGLDATVVNELVTLVDRELARKEIDDFAATIGRHYSGTEKEKLIENLWRVAFEDGRLARFEKRFISRVAGMIGTSGVVVDDARRRALIS